MKKLFKNKKGSEVVQNLIVIAIMGALAISALSLIATKLKGTNNTMLNSIDTSLSSAQNDASN